MATIEDIQYHYDIDNEFYALFLDLDYRAYSCGVWDCATTLEQAQEQKIDRLCNYAGISAGSKVLDVGCGWGGLMNRTVNHFQAATVHGLTLSKDQYSYIMDRNKPGITVSLQAWQAYKHVGKKFDAIVSIGAFEHFASRQERLANKHRDIYRMFFEWSRSITTDDACLGLQTIIAVRQPESLQEARDARYLLDKVFPGTALPSMSDIQVSTSDLYEISTMNRIGLDYEKTLSVWKARFVQHEELIKDRFGMDIFDHYVKYFDAAQRNFLNGLIDLVQISFKPVSIKRSYA